jgi:hypothetical protein
MIGGNVKVQGSHMNLKTTGPIGLAERSETGACYQRFIFEGLPAVVEAYATNLPLGNKASIQNNGPVSVLTVEVGFSATDAKWEFDRENLQQDILSAPFLNPPAGGPRGPISAEARAAFLNWKSQGVIDSEPIAYTGDNPDGWSDDCVWYLNALQSLHLQGVETVPAKALIMKLTATFPVAMFVQDPANEPPALNVDPTSTTIYTSDQIAQAYGFAMYPGFASQLPGLPNGLVPVPSYPNPATVNGTWGWWPRLVNATWIGRGMVQISNDWVFACYSNYLYQLAGAAPGGA